MSKPTLILPPGLESRIRADMATIARGAVPAHQTFAPKPQNRPLQTDSLAVQTGRTANPGLGIRRAAGPRLRQDGLPDFWITP